MSQLLAASKHWWAVVREGGARLQSLVGAGGGTKMRQMLDTEIKLPKK